MLCKKKAITNDDRNVNCNILAI